MYKQYKDSGFRRKKKKISIIYTGGTIEGKIVDRALRPEGRDATLHKILMKKYPRLDKEYEITCKRNTSLLSENMVPDDWGRIARSVAAEINNGSHGIVIAHGTDTMPYTSSALSFMLSEIPVPVVLTGSLIPSTENGTDAIGNLYASIIFSAKSELSGIFVVFKGRNNARNIYQGNRIESIASYENLFNSIDNMILGEITEDEINIFNKSFRKFRYTKSKKIKTSTNLETHVAYFKLFPGFDPENIERSIDLGTKGMILNLFHSGTANARSGKYSKYSIAKAIKKAGKEIPIFGYPLSYDINPPYVTTVALKDAGLIPMKKMSTEASIVKLMWVLGNYRTIEEVKSEMNRNISGEIINFIEDS